MEVRAVCESHLKGSNGTFRCTIDHCSRKVKFQFTKCFHLVCLQCIDSTRGHVVNADGSRSAVVICPQCVKIFGGNSNWTTPEKLLNCANEIAYCMMCFEEEAVYRGPCGHILCFQCLRPLSYDVKSRPRECRMIGCKEIMNVEEMEGLFERLLDLKMWRAIKLPRYQKCERLCGKKAVLVFKDCKHGYCYSCIQTKVLKNVDMSNNRFGHSGMKVLRCVEILCRTTIQENALVYYLTSLKLPVLMTAYLLEFCTGKCFNKMCENIDQTGIRIRNKSCELHHMYCLDCLSAQMEHTPLDYLEIEVTCMAKSCKTATPVSALHEMIAILKNETCKTEIFLRPADVSEKCTGCGKNYACITRLACSHGLCQPCAKDIAQSMMWYDTCSGDKGTCKNIIPVSMFRTILKLTKSEITFSPDQECKDKLVADITLSIDEKIGSLTLCAEIESTSEIKKIKWMQNTREIQINEYSQKYTAEQSNLSRPSLEIHDLNREDCGSYLLNVETKRSNCLSNEVFFHLPDENPMITLQSTSNVVEHYEVLHAKIASKWPVKNTQWQKNCQHLYISNITGKYTENKSDEHNPILTIHNFEKSDEGKYRLLIRCIHGEILSEEVELKIPQEKFKPRKPNADYKPKDYADKQYNESSIRSQVPVDRECTITMVDNPYRRLKLCRLCEDVAVAEITDCHHRFCLNCIAVLTSHLPPDEQYLKCTGGCRSWISMMRLESFLSRPCAVQLELPMFFEIKPGFCYTTCCKIEGIIKAKFCNHSMCLECLQKCKPDEKCKELSCPNTKLPSKYYFEYLISSLCSKKIDKASPFIMQLETCEGYYSIDEWICSTCSSKARIAVIRCGHKICDTCLKHIEKTPMLEYSLVIAKCPGICEELFPLPRFHPKEEELGNNETSSLDKATQPDGSHGQLSDPMKDISTNKATSTHLVSAKNGVFDASGKRKLDAKTMSSDDDNSHPKKVSNSGSRGLSNVGLSCYRNSILQILAETPYFLEGIDQPPLNKEWILTLRDILHGIRTKATEENIDQLRRFHYEFNKSNPEFREYQQDDCLSFLTSILNGIQDICTENLGTSMDPVNIFKGKWRDKYVCKKCSKIELYNNSEFFYLPLPYIAKKNKDATIGSCFLGLLRKELVDMFSCSTCGCTQLTKEMDIFHFPSILVLQLSKFCEVESTSEEYTIEKRSNFVRFWENFDGLKNAELKKKLGEDTLQPYRLFGVVVHWGSVTGGHYVCFVKRKAEQRWEECDDSYVRSVSVESVLKTNAYLLFYERCETEIS